MTPPRPPRSVLALLPAPLDPTADRVDVLIGDARADRARAQRFRRRSSRVLLGLAARSRRVERVTRATLRSSRLGLSTPVVLVVLAVLRALGYIP